MEEAVDLVVGHGLHGVAREARQLGIAVPTTDVRQVVDAVMAEDDLRARHRRRVPGFARAVGQQHPAAMLPHATHPVRPCHGEVGSLAWTAWTQDSGDTGDADTMLRWAQTAERVRATRKTSEKTALIAGYLRTLDDADLATAAVFLSGRPFPEHQQRTTGLGWVALRAVVEEVAGAESRLPRGGLRPVLRPGHGRR